jgi:enoyl-CoA hydratase/carnithine racemase
VADKETKLAEVDELKPVLVDQEGAVATITLNRPSRRNAVTWIMWQELLTALREVATRDDVRIVVLTGAGGSFCSGADFSDALPDIHPYLQLEQINAVVESLHHLPKITLARVNGDAIGAGANLAFVCDLAFASRTSRFAEIFVRRGFSIDCGGSWIIPRLIGLHKAMALCLTGSMVTADEAEALGLINASADESQLDGVIADHVEQLLQGAPMAQLLTKRLLQNGLLGTLSQALEREAQAQVINVGGRDLAEAREAFAERRPPFFTGRWAWPDAPE